jgi:hypothetical protein
MYTLEDIKNIYYTDLTCGLIDQGFDKYLKDNFLPVYDEEFNFIGYDRRL